MGGRQAAQCRVDRIAAFKAELAELEREGALALTIEQKACLDAHHTALLTRWRDQAGSDATAAARRVSWGMRLASLIGTAALLAAGILFLHRVWGNLPTALQLLVLTAAPLALLFGAELTFARGTDPFYTGLFALAAEVIFMMEVNALGAMLNLSDSPQVLLVWGIFAMAIAYAYKLRLLLGTGLVLFCLWSGALVLHLQGAHWSGVLQRTQWLLPSAALIYCLPWLIRGRGPEGFGPIYRLAGGGLGFLSLLLLSAAGDLCCAGLSPNQVAAAYQLAGLLLSLAVIGHGLRLGEGPLVNLGALSFVVFLFTRLHSWWWHWMPKYLFFFILGAIAFGLLLLFRRIRGRLAQGAFV